MAITQATSLADFSTGIGTAGAVLQVDNADGRVGIGTTDPQADLQVGIAITMDGTAGVITASSFSGSGANLTFTGADISAATGTFTGNVSVGGTLTYEDVTNIDSVGIITARSGVRVTGGYIQAGDSSTGFSGTVISGFSTTTSGNAGTIQAKNFGSGGANFVGFDAAGNDTARILTDGGALFASDVSIADKIVHTGDTNTAIRFPAADTFAVETSGSERVRVTSTGIVGLKGTPDSWHNDSSLAAIQLGGYGALHNYYNNVSLSFNAYQDSSSTSKYLTTDQAARYTLDSGGEHVWYTAPSGTADNNITFSEKLRLTSAGRLGIGTNVPARLLHLHEESSDGTLLSFTNTTTGVTGGDGAVIGIQDDESIIISNKENNHIELHTNNTERLRITSGGFVGVNCTPRAQLEVKAGTDANILMTTMSSEAAIEVFNDAGNANVPFRLRATEHKFFISGDEKLRIDSSGRMGLGTNSPGSYVGGGDNFVIADSGDAGMTIATGTSNTATINFADGTSGDARYRGRFEYSHSTDALDILTAATTQMRIHSSGVVSFNSGIELGSGIDATAANTLEDYEEGTFTPTANGFTVSGTTTMTGKYVKIGQLVTIGIKFANTGTIAYGVSCNIASLPFTMAAGTEAHGLIGMLQNSNSVSFNSNIAGTQCKLDGEGGSRFFVGNFTTTSSGMQLIFGGSYISNQ